MTSGGQRPLDLLFGIGKLLNFVRLGMLAPMLCRT
jgi:hypothetical protein